MTFDDMEIDRPILIDWVDSSSTRGWLRMDEINPNPSTICSIGFLVFHSMDTVVIAQSRQPNQAVGYAEALSIPKVAITSWRFLSVPNESVS